ncbi:MAG: hypothetical protein JXA64_02225 [Candidatus Fermentibacteraceae bacterium]|nr:hypothetical protein [Candidatus Fermentibacteraceae bacterium]
MKTAGLTVLSVLCAACTGPAASTSLMDSMPSGHDVYIIMSPERAGIEQVLTEFEGYFGSSDAGPAGAGDVIGFDPLDWQGWTEALTLRPGDDIGLVLDLDQGDIRVITVYLPSDDATAVEGFVTGIRERAGEADAAARFIRTGEYTAVSFFGNEFDPGPETGYHLDSSLRDYPDYSRLAGDPPEGNAVLIVFANAGAFPGTEGLGSALLECTESGSMITIAAGFSTDGDLPYLSILSPGGACGEVTVPEGTNAAARISLDMPCVKDLLVEGGIDREFGMGIEEFGFSSFDEMFDCFGGAFYAGVLLSGEKQGGVLQFSLRDVDAVTRMLDLIFRTVAGSDDPGMTTFEFRGGYCYRTTSTGSTGIDFIEFGIIDDAVAIGANISIEDIAAGMVFSDYASATSLGLDCGGGLIVTADLGSIAGSDAVDEDLIERLNGSGIRRCAASAGYSEGILDAAVCLEFAEGGGFMNLLRFLSGI